MWYFLYCFIQKLNDNIKDPGFLFPFFSSVIFSISSASFIVARQLCQLGFHLLHSNSHRPEGKAVHFLFKDDVVLEAPSIYPLISHVTELYFSLVLIREEEKEWV